MTWADAAFVPMLILSFFGGIALLAYVTRGE
jgi:hypothetical protein